MSINYTQVLVTAIISLIIGAIAGAYLTGGAGQGAVSASGLTSQTQAAIDALGGFKVNGTTVIDTSGNINTASSTFTGSVKSPAFSYGNSSLATTTNAAGTFTAAQICDNDRIVATPNIGNVTLTVASSSAMFADCIPNPGDYREVILQNASTTGTAAITLADLGINTEHLEEEGATTVIDVAEFGILRFRNFDDTTMLFEVLVRQAAD